MDRSVERDLVPALQEYRIGLLPYYPLASGLLTGKYRRGQRPPAGSRLAGRPEALSDAAFDVVEALEKYADQRGISLLDVAIGGLAAQPAVCSVIAGATSRSQVEANVRAGAWAPSADDLAELDRLTRT